jgi:hypothetical protein
MRYSGVIVDFPIENTFHAVGDDVVDVVAGLGELCGGDYSFEFCTGLVWDNLDAKVVATLSDGYGLGLWMVEGGDDIPVPDLPEDTEG